MQPDSTVVTGRNLGCVVAGAPTAGAHAITSQHIYRAIAMLSPALCTFRNVQLTYVLCRLSACDQYYIRTVFRRLIGRARNRLPTEFAAYYYMLPNKKCDGRYLALNADVAAMEMYHYNNGCLHGTYVVQRRNGYRAEAVYVHGKRHGRVRSWHENGALCEEYYCISGSPNGIARSWYANGNIAMEIMYVAGVKHGRYRHWHDSGIQLEMYEYVNGELITDHQKISQQHCLLS